MPILCPVGSPMMTPRDTSIAPSPMMLCGLLHWDWTRLTGVHRVDLLLYIEKKGLMDGRD